MPGSRSRQTPSRGVGIAPWNAVAVDRMIDSYVAWREACARLRSAYEGWGAPNGTDVASARRSGAVCAAALEQEEQAARVYQSWVERVGASARMVASSSPGGSFGRFV